MEKENSTSRVYGAISERENEVVPHLSLRRLALYTLIALGNTADKAEKIAKCPSLHFVRNQVAKIYSRAKIFTTSKARR